MSTDRRIWMHTQGRWTAEIIEKVTSYKVIALYLTVYTGQTEKPVSPESEQWTNPAPAYRIGMIRDSGTNWGYKNNSNLSGGWQQCWDINALLRSDLVGRLAQIHEECCELDPHSRDPDFVSVCEDMRHNWILRRQILGWSPAQDRAHSLEDS